MYPELNSEPVLICKENGSVRVPRKAIASSYAGAWSSKELLLWNDNPLMGGVKISFSDKYRELMPACIEAANKVGLSATWELIDYWNPGKGTDRLLRERLEHSDNPFYPFFED